MLALACHVVMVQAGFKVRGILLRSGLTDILLLQPVNALRFDPLRR